MPPRLQPFANVARWSSLASYQPVAPFLYPFLHQQQRNVGILSQLSDNKGAYNKRIRRGRGPASGKGKTSGRGHKGQNQHGKVPYKFNGGQTRDEVVSGTRGSENHFSVDMSPINLNQIQAWIDKGKLDPSKPITLKELGASRCLHGIKDGVKLLARGKDELRSAINIIVSRASAEAIAAVEKAGGSVTTRYYNHFAIKKIRQGEMDPINSLQSRIAMASGSAEDAQAVAKAIHQENTRYKYRLPDPISRKNIEYYRDSAHRGYLSHMVEEGHGPSLFFRPPNAVKDPKKPLGTTKTRSKRTEGKLW